MVKSKFLKFKKVEDGVYGIHHLVISKKTDDSLGYIIFYKDWKKWVFTPSDDTFYDEVCLRDIIEFIKELSKGDVVG